MTNPVLRYLSPQNVLAFSVVSPERSYFTRLYESKFTSLKRGRRERRGTRV